MRVAMRRWEMATGLPYWLTVLGDVKLKPVSVKVCRDGQR